MKVIFLDIDGVLNTTDTFIKRSEEYKKTGIYKIEVDEFRLEYLKEIIDKTNAKIVLSSSWRYFFTKSSKKVIPRTQKGKELYDLFLNYDIEIYDIISINGNSREGQINEWLENNSNIESFIIIDDEPNMFNELSDRLIQTSIVKSNEMLMNMDDCIGLCEHHIYSSINMLKSKVKIKK